MRRRNRALFIDSWRPSLNSACGELGVYLYTQNKSPNRHHQQIYAGIPESSAAGQGIKKVRAVRPIAARSVTPPPRFVIGSGSPL